MKNIEKKLKINNENANTKNLVNGISSENMNTRIQNYEQKSNALYNFLKAVNSLYKDSKIITKEIFRSSYAGSKLMNDVEYLFKNKKETNIEFKNSRSERYTMNSKKILALSDKSVTKYKDYGEYVNDNYEKILNNFREILIDPNDRNKKLIMTSLLYWLDITDQLNFSSEYLVSTYKTACYINGKIKSNMTKFNKTIFFVLFNKNNKNYKIEKKMSNSNLKYQNELSKLSKINLEKYVDDLSKKVNEYMRLSEEEIINTEVIKKMRRIQRSLMVKESKACLGGEEEISWVNDFKYPDAAHIVSVKTCIENKNFEWIADPNNAVFLDPNTHRLFDKNILELKPDFYFWDIEKNEKIKLLKNEIMNDERKSFIEKRNKLKKEIN